ncbi:hypothetical protein [Caminibacter pacificus]
MKYLPRMFLSNQKTKYGYIIPAEAIEKAYYQKWKFGTPMFISHDYTRPYGWSIPIGMFISPLDVRLYGIGLFPENKEEENEIRQKSENYLNTQIFNVDKKDINRLQNLLGKHLSGNEVYMRRECVCVIDKDIVKKVLPDLHIDENDKRALVSLKDLEIVAPGVFEYKGYTLLAHRFFRRNMSDLNNLNDIFLKKLCKLKDNPNLNIKIAIDPHTIGLKDTYLEPIELEYWWGPKFSDSLLEIEEGVSVYKASEEERFFYGIDETQFWWHKQNGIQSLECEELRDIPSYGISNEKYACRYVHSMIDEKTGLANHLDGAVRIYGEEEYLKRLEHDISKAGKNTKYIKLWRIDGEISLSLWKELINDFYRDNHQVGEYLLGKELDKSNDYQSDTEQQKYLKIPLVEYILSTDGYNIFLSYHEKDKFSTFSNDKNIIVVDESIEYCSIDLFKLLKKESSKEVYIKTDINYIAYEDLDINFPLIIHTGENAVEYANKTMEYIYELCESFYKKNEDRCVTFNVGIEYKEFIAIFSFITNIQVFYELKQENKIIKFPIFEEIGKWCEEQYSFLNKKYKAKRTYENHLNFHLLKFKIKRFNITEFIEINEDKNFILKVPEEYKILAEAVANRKLEVVSVLEIEESICRKCNKDYTKCNCSAILEEDVTVEIKNGNLLGFILTRNMGNY